MSVYDCDTRSQWNIRLHGFGCFVVVVLVAGVVFLLLVVLLLGVVVLVLVVVFLWQCASSPGGGPQVPTILGSAMTAQLVAGRSAYLMCSMRGRKCCGLDSATLAQ